MQKCVKKGPVKLMITLLALSFKILNPKRQVKTLQTKPGWLALEHTYIPSRA